MRKRAEIVLLLLTTLLTVKNWWNLPWISCKIIQSNQLFRTQIGAQPTVSYSNESKQYGWYINERTEPNQTRTKPWWYSGKDILHQSCIYQTRLEVMRWECVAVCGVTGMQTKVILPRMLVDGGNSSATHRSNPH